MFVVVGAGLAGLTCAKVLAQAGRDVLVLEASDGVGGRVRTDLREGFRLDRGFQVLFTAYPAAQRHLDLAALGLRSFQPGAFIAHKGKLFGITDPFRDRHLNRLAATLTNPLISLGDKVRVAVLREEVRRTTIERILHPPHAADHTTLEVLVANGFAKKGFIDQFVRPFYGGIFLNRDLHTSARMFQFTFKMLAEGETVVPALGMGALAEQLVRHLPSGAVRTQSPVSKILRRKGRVVGVQLATDEIVEADAVILAVEAPEAQRLSGIDLPAEARPVAATCLYFANSESLYEGPTIVLNVNPTATVNHVVQLTNIAPDYAPAGQHLLSVTVLGQPTADDATLAEQCRADLARIFPRANLAHLRHLATYRIPMAQFDQPPGIFDELPGNTTATPGLLLAGEYTESSSIHGAMQSGEKAARALLATS
jgi:phytoene dehydrogenase-like protein